MGAFSNYTEASLLDYIIATLGNYVSLHEPLVLNVDAAAGAGTIDVNAADNAGNAFAPEAGSRIVIGTEQHEVIAVTGAGPYTLDLEGTLANAYTAGELVGYAGETALPTEKAFTGYARQQPTWNAATQGNPTEKTTSGSADFGDPDTDGAVGSFGIWDATKGAAGENMLVSDVLDAVATHQAAVNDPISIPAGSLTLTLD